MNILHSHIAWSSHLILTKEAFPDLPGCLSVGETIDEAVANANDAKREWLAAAIEDCYPINEPDDIENYSGQFKLPAEEPA